MIPVRQSTAFEIAVGPVLDADGVAVTDCVVGDFKIKKTTGNFAALNASATLTHVSAGFYDLVLTTSDVDTVGLNTVAIDDTVNACAPLYLQVVEEAIYDAFYAASATGLLPANVTQLLGTAWLTPAVAGTPDVNAKQVGGTAQTGRDIGASVLLSNGTGTGQVALTNGTVDLGKWKGSVPANLADTDKVPASVQHIHPDRLMEIQSGLALETTSQAILADTDSLDTTKLTTARAAVLTDWIDGGRLDLILDSRASQTSVDTIDDLLDTEMAAVQTTLNALFTTAMTESYRAAGAAPTMAQAQFELLAHMGDMAIVGALKTLNKIDGTAAKTFTLDSATVPTSITETT